MLLSGGVKIALDAAGEEGMRRPGVVELRTTGLGAPSHAELKETDPGAGNTGAGCMPLAYRSSSRMQFTSLGMLPLSTSFLLTT